MRFSQIRQLPQVGDKIFINDKGSMRPATVILSERDGYIEFELADDGTSWSLSAVLAGEFNLQIFTESAG